MTNKSTRWAVSISMALALAVTGCSTKGGSSTETKTDDSGVKTGVGVTDDTISIGVLTDQTGVFKTVATGFARGNEVWADEVNDAGGICGRDIKLEIRDTGYAADKAVALYPEVKDKVLGVMQLVGSPILAALKSQITSDKIVTIPMSWASTNLDSEAVMMLGATYDVEMINGLGYLKDEGIIAKGDKIGHIYIDSEYGQGGLLGSKHFAEQNDMELVDVKVTASDADMSAAVTQLKSAEVKAIAITLAPAAASSVLTQDAAQGLNVPVIGNNPAFDVTLLSTPAKAAFEELFYRVTGVVPWNADGNATAQKIATEYEAKYQEGQSDNVNMGYLSGVAYQALLEKACDNKDLTRDGMIKALSETKVDGKDIGPNLDFSKPGEPSSRESLIVRPDSSVVGGLVVVQKSKASDEAKSYKTPLQK